MALTNNGYYKSWSISFCDALYPKGPNGKLVPVVFDYENGMIRTGRFKFPKFSYKYLPPAPPVATWAWSTWTPTNVYIATFAGTNGWTTVTNFDVTNVWMRTATFTAE